MPDRPASNDASDPRLLALQRELSACGAHVEALRREQQVLAHAIAHDLRAPLRSVDRFAALLERDAALDPAAAATLARIRGAAAAMGTLIDGLLEFLHVGQAPLAPAPVDLSALADWVLGELQEADPTRPLLAAITPGLMVEGDERLLRILLRQLLHNAWKFARPGAPVHIEIRGGRTGDRVQVALRDAGIGFDMRYAGKLFQPFQRLHGPDHGGGHGLGLAIAQRIAARHGGHITAESEPGAGSTFLLDLPAATAFDRSTP
jgi:signal transduction histidine kinase